MISKIAEYDNKALVELNNEKTQIQKTNNELQERKQK